MSLPVYFKQEVNQWLCIALISLMCFWTVIYYIANTAQDIGNGFVAQDNL